MNRKELYDLVWSTPMVHAAKRFGISDVALRKTCVRHDVPTPPLGYWAKLAHGKKVRQPPLPALIGERIRDKFAASRRRGMWMGGTVPFGYVVCDRKLVIQEKQAATVRMIFERFARVGSATKLAAALAREGVLTPRGKPIDKGFLYKLLTNRLYIGDPQAAALAKHGSL